MAEICADTHAQATLPLWVWRDREALCSIVANEQDKHVSTIARTVAVSSLVGGRSATGRVPCKRGAFANVLSGVSH
ncbi:unnamed protein product, partial [Iphiclides podalirius]